GSKWSSRTSARAEARLGAGEQAFDVGAVARDDQRRKKNPQRHQRRRITKNPQRRGRRERGAERGERHEPARQRQRRENRQRRPQRLRREREQNAESGGYSFAAAEFQKYRKQMAQECGGAGQRRRPIAERHLARRQRGEKSFGDVGDQSQKPAALPHHPRHVGGADVAAARGPHIDAGELAQNEAARNRTDQIGNDREDGFHGAAG